MSPGAAVRSAYRADCSCTRSTYSLGKSGRSAAARAAGGDLAVTCDTTLASAAVTDPSPASDIDGPALLARLAIKPARTLGAVDTDEVAFLLTTGAAQAGLLHMTDVRADPRLAAVRPVPAEAQLPPLYAAAVTRLARRPNPEDFVAFLTTREAGDILVAAGLEAIT